MVDCDGNQATLELNLVPIAIDNKIIEIKIAMFSYKEGSHMHLLHRTKKDGNLIYLFRLIIIVIMA